MQITDPWIAVMVNVMVYAFTHIPKGRVEAFGAMALGFILCLATLQTGSFWVAFLVHVCMAWSNEYFALRTHPNIESPMKIRRR
jgi:membrane protease YdiL (CAAX protease family)